MKVVSIEALTKLIQLVKSAFIKVDDVVEVTEIETETPSEITLATVATSGDYDDLTNKPTINNATLTITQGGTTKGTFTANASSDTTIALDAGTTYTEGTGIDITNNVVSVTSPTLTNNANAGTTIALAVGKSSSASERGTSVGWGTSTGDGSVAVGSGSQANVSNAVQLGRGTNTEIGTFYVGVNTSNYKMLDPFGVIPDARISGNIARTSAIPAAQVNSDWNAVSGVAQILNKPTLGTMASESASDYTKTSGLATVATSGSYADLTNKPTDFTGADGTNAGTHGFVPAPTATDNDKFLKGDGTWSAPSGGADLQDQVGMVKGYAGTTPPKGWLFCDGAAISRTTYAALFAIIGTTYGAGNGTTTFNLPNMRLHGGTLAVSVYGQDKALGLVSKTPTGGYKGHSVCTAGNPAYIVLGNASNSSVSGGGTTASSNSGNGSWAAANLVGVNTAASASGLAGSATINNSTQTMKLIIKYRKG